MDAVAKLIAIEELKQLKARYFYHLDRKEWADFGAVFIEDAVLDFSSHYADAPDPSLYILHGRDALIAGVSEALAITGTVHHGHNPLFVFTEEDTASGVWAMEDNLFEPDGTWTTGYGHYHEEYRRTDDRWKIARTTLVRSKLVVRPEPEQG